MNQVLVVVAGGAAVLSLLLVVVAILTLRARRWLGGTLALLLGLLALALAALAGLVAVGTAGYRSLTHEEVVATVTTVPSGPQAFRAAFRFPDGRIGEYDLEGDEVLIDAHILKWRYSANLLGLTTQYELDRIAGRWASAEDERSRRHTVYSLSQPKPFDFFNLARRYTPLAFLVDAEYGSGTFVQVGRPAQYEVSVSTTGLLIRKIGEVVP